MSKLSIITVNYNNSNGLRKTMQSVFSQVYREYEYLIIDGNSTDESKEIITEHADKLSYWVSEKDKGVYDAMNKGIKAATGDYIMFLNSGDILLHKNVLENFITINQNEKAAIYFGNIEIIDDRGKANSVEFPTELTLGFWETATINHQAAFIKASLFKELGLYNLKYSLAADYAFFLKAFICGKQFLHIKESLVHYNLDGASSWNMDSYKLQMQTAWENIVPGYLKSLYKEDKAKLK